MAYTHKVLLASFDTTEGANKVFRDITDNSHVTKDQITVITQQPDDIGDAEVRTKSDVSVTSDAVTGGAIGALAGLLVSAASIILPGIGTIAVAGPIAIWLGLTGVAATTVTGATAGVVTGGLIGALRKLGLSEDEAREYETAVKSGGVFMAVPVLNDENALRKVFEDHGADHIRVMNLETEENIYA